MLGEAHSNSGRFDEGVMWLEKARQAVPYRCGWLGYLGRAYVRAGRRTDAERLLADLEQERERYVSGYAPALCALALGDTERALDWLNNAVENRDGGVGFLPGNIQLKPLRGHPRVIEIMKRSGLPSSHDCRQQRWSCEWLADDRRRGSPGIRQPATECGDAEARSRTARLLSAKWPMPAFMSAVTPRPISGPLHNVDSL